MAEGKKNTFSFTIYGLMFLAGYILLLYFLSLFGCIIFVNRFALFTEQIAHLGSSIYFFTGDFVILTIFCLQLAKALRESPVIYSEVRFWDAAANICIMLFFGIGVIYTAIGMQRAFQIALGSITPDLAAKQGPWGILQALVEGGLLMALLTTIVGGALGYSLRLIKFLLFGKKLVYLKDEQDIRYSRLIAAKLDNIDNKLLLLKVNSATLRDE